MGFWKDTGNLFTLPSSFLVPVTHNVSKHVKKKKSSNMRNRHPERNFEEIETFLGAKQNVKIHLKILYIIKR